MLSDEKIIAGLSRVVARRTADTGSTFMGAGNDDLEQGHSYLAAAVAEGWAVPAWPVEYGGRDADAEEVAAIRRVSKEFALPDLYAYAIGLGMVGPCLLIHGTPEQQLRWLPKIADGSEIWCQMFSEPEAGSDLANVAMRAQRDGQEWILDGQKVWTSRSSWARWGICLTRTDPEAPKHRGLTMFAVDMETPGVEVRPLVQMNGDRHFAEVFVTGARVPDANRVGDMGQGWSVAMTILAHERSRMTSEGPANASERLPRWLRLERDQGHLRSVIARDRAMRAYILAEVARLTELRSAAEVNSGRPGPAGSVAKLLTVRRSQAEAHFRKDVAGAAGMLTDHDGHLEFLTAPSMSIRGGTDEIQHNILGERVLGLPSEPRFDRDVPWSGSRQGMPPASSHRDLGAGR